MSSVAMLVRSASSRIRFMIAAWVVTSSPVVGSSATRSAGEQASASAIITRWHMPPESSNGYAAYRRSGSGICTCASSSIARRLTSPRPTLAWRSSTSPIWRPTGRIGLSAVRGFWKIMESSRPRCRPSSCSPAVTRSRPPNTALPEVIRAEESRMRSRANAVTDLPEPLSPTTPTVSPRWTSKLTWSSARTTPPRVRNSTERSCTASSGIGGSLTCVSAGR